MATYQNGFSATYNWSRLGPRRKKTARLIRNGEEVASHTFMVTAFDMEFVTGAEGMCTLTDFPEMGKNATFVWEQSQPRLGLGGGQLARSWGGATEPV